jgi:hypothetical protein
MRGRDVLLDDVKCFEEFCNQKTCVQSIQNDEDFESVPVPDRWVKCFQKMVSGSSPQQQNRLL